MTTQPINFPNNHKPGTYHAESSTDGCDEVLSIFADVDGAVLAQIFFFGDGGDETARRAATFCLLSMAPDLFDLAKRIITARCQGEAMPDDLYTEAMRIFGRLNNPEGACNV